MRHLLLLLVLALALLAGCSNQTKETTKSVPGLGVLPGDEVVPGEAFVGYREPEALEKAVAALGGEVIEDFPALRLARVKLPENLPLEKAKNIAANISGVRYLEPHRVYWLKEPSALVRELELGVPQIAVEVTDPDFDRQWMHRQLKTPEAWAQGYTGQGVRIGVHDTLVDIGHPDLAENIAFPGYHAVTDELICPDSPWVGVETHGTMVAGTAAAVANDIGGRGVAPGAKVVTIAIDDPETGALSLLGIVRGAIFAALGPEALGHAVPPGCDLDLPSEGPFVDVVNMSWGSLAYDQVVKDVVDFMLQNGVIAVTSAGNTPTTGMAQPAWYPGLITVAATQPDGNRTSFSNRGQHLTVAAPGEMIWTTTTRACLAADPTGAACPPDAADYTYTSGTSFSSPATAGVVALVLEAAGGPGALDARQVRKILVETAYDPQGDGFDEDLGWGIVDAAAAVARAGEAPPEEGVDLTVLVVDATTNTPIPQVAVTLEPLDPDTIEPKLLFTQTTGSGAFAEAGLAFFPQISPGNYRVLVGGPHNIRGVIPGTLEETIAVTPEDDTFVLALDVTLPTDPYEPNDDLAQATPAEVGKTYEGTIYSDAGGDVDYYAVELTAGTTYVFNTETISGAADLKLELYDAAGNLLAENSANQTFTYDAYLVFTPDADGTYYVAVLSENLSNSPFDSYALDIARFVGQETEPNGSADVSGTNITNVDFAQAESLAVGSAVAAALDFGDADIFRLSLTAGTVLVADTETENSGEPDTMLALYDEKGTLLALNDDYTGRESRLLYPVDQDGTYYLVVVAWDGDNPDNATTGDYILSVTTLDLP